MQTLLHFLRAAFRPWPRLAVCPVRKVRSMRRAEPLRPDSQAEWNVTILSYDGFR